MARIRYESETPDGPMRKVIAAAQAKGEKEAVLWAAPVTETHVTKTRVTENIAPVTENRLIKRDASQKIRGRPKKDDAKSQANRAKAYRARKKKSPP